MNFNEEAKLILSKYPTEKVSDFLKEVDSENTVLNYKEEYAGFKYYSKSENVIVNSKKAIKALKGIASHPLYGNHPFGVEWDEQIRSVIAMMQYVIDVNDQHRPSGRPTSLTFPDRFILSMLKSTYNKHFPDQSVSFKKGTTLHQLGCALIKKDLLDTTDQLIK